MDFRDLVAQFFGLIGLVIIVMSFQCKKNRNFFLLQGIGSFMFFINFILINAFAGALFNLTNLFRGLLFSKEDKKLWKLITVIACYTACFVFSAGLIWGDWFMIFISALPYVTLVIMSVLMWKDDGKKIRYFQICALSPSWLIHNIFNFTLGGILAEVFNIVSAVVSLIRFKENKNKI